MIDHYIFYSYEKPQSQRLEFVTPVTRIDENLVMVLNKYFHNMVEKPEGYLRDNPIQIFLEFKTLYTSELDNHSKKFLNPVKNVKPIPYDSEQPLYMAIYNRNEFAGNPVQIIDKAIQLKSHQSYENFVKLTDFLIRNQEYDILIEKLWPKAQIDFIINYSLEELNSPLNIPPILETFIKFWESDSINLQIKNLFKELEVERIDRILRTNVVSPYSSRFLNIINSVLMEDNSFLTIIDRWQTRTHVYGYQEFSQVFSI